MIPMTRLLENSGYKAMGTTDSSRALEQVKELQPDLVFIDFHMPEKNGLTLAGEIHEMDPSIKIIMLSGSSLEDLGINLRDPQYSFIKNYLIKPTGIEVLTNTIERTMRGE